MTQTPLIEGSVLPAPDQAANDFHKIVQNMIIENAQTLCGFEVSKASPEDNRFIQVDIACSAHPDRKVKDGVQGVRPMAHWRGRNVVEIEGRNRTVSEKRLRYHTGRALVFENHPKKPSDIGETTLTILAMRQPKALLALDEYCWRYENNWKIHSDAYPRLSVTLIIIPTLRNEEGGEALAWLKLLDPSPTKRKKTWESIVHENYPGKSGLKNLMLRLDKETYMTIAEEWKQEGIEQGIEKGIEKGIEQGIEQGIEKGFVKGIHHTALNMIRGGFDDLAIRQVCSLSVSDLKALKMRLANS